MKAQVRLVGLMLGVVIIVLVLALAFPIKQANDNARNESSGDTIGMNCSTTTDNFVKATCVAADLNLFLFVGGILFLAGVVMTAKIIANR